MSLYVTAFDGMGSGEDSGGGALQNLAGIEASDIMHIANDFLDQEGVQSIDDGDFECTADGTNLEIDIDTGVAYIKNDAWVKATSVTKFWRVESDATEVVTLAAADASLDRIDIVVLKINDAASADDEASNVASVDKITGTPAASPVAPSVPDDALKLAEVYVSAGVTTVSNSDITDSRVEAKLSNVVVDSVLLENNTALQAKDSGGTARDLLKINGSDEAELGNTNLGLLKLSNNVTNVYQHRAKAYLTSNEAFTGNLDVSFTSEEFDIGGLHSNVSNPERITVQEDGLYLVIGQLRYNSVAANSRYACIVNINGLNTFLNYEHAGDDTGVLAVQSFGVAPMSSGDYFTLEAFHNAGNNQTLINTATFLIVVKIA